MKNKKRIKELESRIEYLESALTRLVDKDNNPVKVKTEGRLSRYGAMSLFKESESTNTLTPTILQGLRETYGKDLTKPTTQDYIYCKAHVLNFTKGKYYKTTSCPAEEFFLISNDLGHALEVSIDEDFELVTEVQAIWECVHSSINWELEEGQEYAQTNYIVQSGTYPRIILHNVRKDLYSTEEGIIKVGDNVVLRLKV